MTTDCDMRLTSQGPIAEVLMRAERKWEGWSLWIRHRHVAGLFTDCPAAEYHGLDAGTFLDVVDAEMFLWDPDAAV